MTISRFELQDKTEEDDPSQVHEFVDLKNYRDSIHVHPFLAARAALYISLMGQLCPRDTIEERE